MSYRFILLDADNTLFDFNACEKEAFLRTMRQCNVTADEALYARYSAINDACWKALERGEITRDALKIKRFSLLAGEFSLQLSPEKTNALYMENLSRQSILIPGALEFVSALRDFAKVYIITNGLQSVQVGRFQRSPLTPLLDGIFISEAVGASKPDVAFFTAVAGAIPNFNASQAIVIGDSLTSDIRGANNAGLDCIWFNPKGLPRSDARIDFEAKNYTEILAFLQSRRHT